MYTGGIDNTIKVWDLRKEEVSFTLEGHGDTITGMRAHIDPSLSRAVLIASKRLNSPSMYKWHTSGVAHTWSA